MGSTKLATRWVCLGTGGRQGAQLGKVEVTEAEGM